MTRFNKRVSIRQADHGFVEPCTYTTETTERGVVSIRQADHGFVELNYRFSVLLLELVVSIRQADQGFVEPMMHAASDSDYDAFQSAKRIRALLNADVLRRFHRYGIVSIRQADHGFVEPLDLPAFNIARELVSIRQADHGFVEPRLRCRTT